jgi:hypothetical protein
MKKISLFAITFCTGLTMAQNADDALRYSQQQVIGTARNTGMGGSFGALGGDISSASINPAGLAVYRSSELNGTLGLFATNHNASFNGSRQDEQSMNIAMGNIGLVGTTMLNNTNNGSGWVSTTFSFGYNRLNNFYSNTRITGENFNNSLLDVFVDQANRQPNNLDLFGADLAYNANLIYTDSVNGRPVFTSDIPGAGNGVLQNRNIYTTGGMGETFFSFAGNYGDKLYLGATIGYTSVRFNYTSNHREDVMDDDYLSSFNYYEEFRTRGGGFNFKFGFLVRPIDWLRLGASVHTPTFLNLTDNFNASIISRFQPQHLEFDRVINSTNGSFSYSVTTPMRTTASIGFVILKSGLINVDYEFVDYSSARLASRNTGNFGMTENDQIRNNLSSAGNLRIGAEWRINPFAIRAGYGMMGNPYNNSLNTGSSNNYSIGFGIREKEYYLDFAYMLSQVRNNLFYMYDPVITNLNPVSVNKNLNTFLTTIGFRF